MKVEVVATDLGSLPDGGFEEQTPIYRADQSVLDRGMRGAHSYQASALMTGSHFRWMA